MEEVAVCWKRRWSQMLEEVVVVCRVLEREGVGMSERRRSVGRERRLRKAATTHRAWLAALE